MTWHYLTACEGSGGDDEWWTIREVYDVVPGMPSSWTAAATAPAASSHAELLEVLRTMLRDAERSAFVDLDAETIRQRPGGLRGMQ